MIILSVGMPRAGSGWHYNLIHDLMEVSGARDAREIRKQYHLEKILTEVNCNIGVLSYRRLVGVMVPSLTGNTFVIKAHSGPTDFAVRLMRSDKMRATYIYRDPRDAMLSAHEYGRRAVESGRPNAFSHLVDFDSSVKFMLPYLKIWEDWMGCEEILKTRYEDMLANYDVEVTRLIQHLKLDTGSEAVKGVVEKYRPGQAKQGHDGLHFFKGGSGRFREKYSTEEQAVLAEKFGPYLEKMGYPI
jgi:hypothetical protein